VMMFGGVGRLRGQYGNERGAEDAENCLSHGSLLFAHL
jgi:hypothetical protein